MTLRSSDRQKRYSPSPSGSVNPLGELLAPLGDPVWFDRVTINGIYGFSDNDPAFAYSDDRQSTSTCCGPIAGQHGHFPARRAGETPSRARPSHAMGKRHIQCAAVQCTAPAPCQGCGDAVTEPHRYPPCTAPTAPPPPGDSIPPAAGL